jgi:hypothetical protein
VELYLHSPNKPSWRGALLKHTDFTFTFTLKVQVYVLHTYRINDKNNVFIYYHRSSILKVDRMITVLKLNYNEYFQNTFFS